ncbi:MAG: hypothetical protein IPL95_16865 [Saprospiraceae bacterium]|nr:hypothetical protein [Saprospiraceae bacterium]
MYIQEEIRPGHFRDLKKHSYDKYKIQPGRYDLISDITKIDKSNELFIHNDNRDKISSFIRTHKTTIIYDYSQKTNQEDNSKVVIPEDDINNKEEQVDLKNIFKNKLPPLDEDGQIDLRKIKTSKAVRGQIIKLFQNFRNQFNDTVNLNLFLDILPFVWDFSELIKAIQRK